jgi:transporter family-2 protein
MNYSWLLIGIALLAGAGLPLQASLNAQLGKFLGHPLLAGFVSFVVGALSLLLILLLMKVPLQGIAGGYRSVGIWHWMSGTLGAFFVTTALIVAPRMGSAITFSLIIAGQLMLALLLDHFGLIGTPVHTLNGWRIAGVVLLLAGVIIIRSF